MHKTRTRLFSLNMIFVIILYMYVSLFSSWMNQWYLLFCYNNVHENRIKETKVSTQKKVYGVTSHPSLRAPMPSQYKHIYTKHNVGQIQQHRAHHKAVHSLSRHSLRSPLYWTNRKWKPTWVSCRVQIWKCHHVSKSEIPLLIVQPILDARFCFVL